MQPLPLELAAGDREHILVVQDGPIFHTNDGMRSVWLAKDEAMTLCQKGKGRAVHVSDFLCGESETGRLSLSEAQCVVNNQLPAEPKLDVTDARKIIYPGEGKDDWWNMHQLLL